MKLKNLGRAVLAVAASAGSILGMTSCSRSYTVGYLFVTGAQYNQITNYRIVNNTGQLRAVKTVGSGGFDPIQVLVNASGTYLYVLNAGCGDTVAGQAACPSGTATTASQITEFSIGGQGVLTPQQTFTSQGRNTISIQLTGNYLYALDKLSPAATSTNRVGDITAFSVDPNTGRLAVVQNTQQKDANGLPLNYFPVGTNPTWLALGGSYAFVAEQGPAGGSTDPNDPEQAIFIYNQSATNGQLTLTQSTPTPTGADQLTYLYSTGTTLYALDGGNSINPSGQILPYTVGANGLLSAISPKPNDNVGGAGGAPIFPSRVIKESSHGFLWVANSGVNTINGQPASLITNYFINTNGQLTNITNAGNFIPVGTSPQCIVEDPSNQYVYTANFNDSTLTGKKIDQSAGGLSALNKPMPAAPGSPTWCAVTGSTF